MGTDKGAGILVERDGAVGWVRINRPERLNSLVYPMREELDEALGTLEADPEVRCVVITGNGRAFCTGGDISAMQQLVQDEDVARFEKLLRAGARVVERIHHMSKPVLAAVNGPAAGAGACLALACDLRIASETATLGLTFARIGLHMDWGGTYFLPRVVGPALAAELAFTGGMMAAERAERLGIFNRVVPAAELEAAARGLAGQIAAGPRDVIARSKEMLRRSLHCTLEEMLEAEVEAQAEAFQSPDFREGLRAFMEKRTPRFGRHANGGTAAKGTAGAVRGVHAGKHPDQGRA